MEAADLVTFTEEILNGKLHFLCIESLFLSREIFYLQMIPKKLTVFQIFCFSVKVKECEIPR